MAKKRPLAPGTRRQAAPAEPAEGEENLRLLYPLAASIRLAYIIAYRAHYQAHHGVPSDFGSKPMPRWDGGQSADGRTYKPIWYKIARIAQANQVAPDDLIRAAFSGWSDKLPPFPSTLASEATVAKAVANPGVTTEDAARALEVQKGIWKNEVFFEKRYTKADTDAAARSVLRNRRLELSSMFRYCMASQAGDAALAEEFESGALHQYTYNRRAYDKGWGDMVPDRLKALADRLQKA